MTPLRLTWRLSSPIACSGYPIHLDDLVAFAQTQIGLRMAATSDEDRSRSIRDLAKVLPLERIEANGECVWKASALTPVPGAKITHGMRFWTRKFDSFGYADLFKRQALDIRARPENLKPYSLTMRTQGGLFKNGFKFYAVKHVEAVQAWCVGDKDALTELLDPQQGSPVSWIGARGRSGLGRIASFEIEEDDSALTLWAQRTLPWPHDGAVQMDLATKPPYWDVANRRVAWLNPDLIM